MLNDRKKYNIRVKDYIAFNYAFAVMPIVVVRAHVYNKFSVYFLSQMPHF